ncbi:FG-GAP repeat, partial [Trinorchestia longiramus]
MKEFLLIEISLVSSAYVFMTTQTTEKPTHKMASLMRYFGYLGYLRYLAFLALLVPVPAFNLDMASSVVLAGTNGTNFGYSVALWYHAPEKYQRLVVGSPLFPCLQRSGGAVFFCHPHTGQCLQEPQATASLQGHDTNVLEQVDKNLRAEIGFGETLASLPTSPHLLVCAPRYPFHQFAEKKYEGIFPRGACVKLGPGRPQPLVLVTDLYTLAHTAEGRLVKRLNTIRHTGFSVAGFSAVLTQNDQYYIGGPMAFYGQGTAFWKAGVDYSFFKRQINKAIDKDFSLGFWAMAAAKLDGSNEYLAATAPNDFSAKGSVNIYSMTGTSLSPRRPRSGVSLQGAESGGMYGYSVTAGDWDGDGVDDLAVGAPYTGAHGARFPDSGSVHIVYGPMLDGVERPAQWLRGEVSFAHFGLAVTGTGDLDRDGRNDLVVAAPDDDHGKVFIFNGGPDGLHVTPSQVLSGRDMLRPVFLRPARFGFSLSGGQDIDGNGCPDLLVGAVGANQAVYVRTAPVLTVVGKLEFYPSVVALRSRLCNRTSLTGSTDSFTCFELRATLQYNSSVYFSSVDVDLSLSVDERYPFLRSLFWINNERRQLTSLRLNHVTESPTNYTTLVYIK